MPIVQLEALQPYENVFRVKRNPGLVAESGTAIPEPIEPLHAHPPNQKHTLSSQASHFRDCFEPIKFFEAIFRP